MDPQQAIDLGRQALWVVVKISTPMLIVAMVVGVVMGIFQAMTSIQEMTLAFVPKIALVIIVLLLTLPWMIQELMDYVFEIMKYVEGTEVP